MNVPARSSDAGRILTLSAAARPYLDELRLSGRSAATLRARKNAFTHFGRFWGERDVREATSRDMERYAAHAIAGLARETAYQYLATIRALFRWLGNRGEILIDPAATLALPRMRARKIGRALSEAEMARLIDHPDVATPEGVRDRALLELLYSTGVRALEARKLRPEDVGVDAVTVRGGKGGRDRKVPFGKAAKGWVDRYLAEGRPTLARPDVPELWVTGRGRAFGEAWFARHLRQIGRATGIEGVTCHAIRRSMATHLLSAGAAAAEVSAILGHADLSSLGRYARALDQDVRETHRRTHPREQP